ncbi:MULTISPECIES: glycosyltransferase family 4 protein [Paenibacillus]|uniref:Glycosyltransferase family 4 protein n=1 Tax=Paenibacillus ottowii TaxID=2315729 RepID=A0ABY3B184_9BACL|nr:MULTISPECIES: glycosyltransferase family 4 protein [Paenibacillus]KZE72421.1 glycosyl transferase [Paenibacillus jamilae]NEU29146.1 glycosyltransferase family 4 protein [Paenibacillus polymyxa]OBA04279.1 glycosyl transferase [Paenibacillus polymyxa]TQR95475.1 glycosyltransferase family 4 protein [Paenibacillus ottowii]
MASKPSRALDNRPLTIVQVISNYPNAQPVPSIKGGTEKIVHELTEELVRRGHHVSLFAARGSRSSAQLITYPKGLTHSQIPQYVLQHMPSGTDIIHDHTFRSAMGRRKLPCPSVCTVHLPVKRHGKNPVYVSKRARQLMGGGKGFYIYNGINTHEYEFSSEKRGYLLFMGRIIPDKGVLQAIQVAERTGKKLLIAGPIKAPVFFRREIQTRIQRNPNIRYVGSVGGDRKQKLLKHAECLLFPSLWEEPFGLVMVEAMACGTPVLALKNGSVSEVLSGFPQLICKSVGEMARKAHRKNYPSPAQLRLYVNQRFTNKQMTSNYLRLYREIIRRREQKRGQRKSVRR